MFGSALAIHVEVARLQDQPDISDICKLLGRMASHGSWPYEMARRAYLGHQIAHLPATAPSQASHFRRVQQRLPTSHVVKNLSTAHCLGSVLTTIACDSKVVQDFDNAIDILRKRDTECMTINYSSGFMSNPSDLRIVLF